MQSRPEQSANPPRRIQLPRSSTRLERPQVYVRIVTAMHQEAWGAVTYDGPLHAPGAVVDFASLPDPAVAIECAGPVGVWQRGKHREILYILWVWDSRRLEWREIARALALNWAWTSMLREACYQALHPRPELVDVIQRSRDVTEEILQAIERRLDSEMREVRASVLHSVYEQVAGRIVNCA
jgi:hypothetical protein